MCAVFVQMSDALLPPGVNPTAVKYVYIIIFAVTFINLSPVHPIVRVLLVYSSPITIPFIFIPIFLFLNTYNKKSFNLVYSQCVCVLLSPAQYLM
jgi:hypothetical protein